MKKVRKAIIPAAGMRACVDYVPHGICRLQ